ncbi:MAG: UDP-N-acetylglucosamine 2-epimerase [Methanolobus sp.]|uniref:UDP-N-acetylglucosamine 2-epimerase n=1 Tax=Methanolobus sp. TaxID=1874737 RepID=UPI00272FB61A|nr:UDP-N-acetylglucosamine 2-epimerase [Methanolobus sp.]MDP2217210.1 UDP-N-acetylglucosamine 2-epimerase [Methanolobus sp.]
MKILIPVGCRSDEGLSVPVRKRLGNSGYALKLQYHDFYNAYCEVEKFILEFKPDLALLFGDRIEMCGAAAACFHNNIPIAHVYAGTGNNTATLDDISRHVITLWSDIQFCESDSAAKRVENLLTAIGKKPNWYVVGITHLDDVAISEKYVPKEPYDLVLYNPITAYSKLKNINIMAGELNEIKELIKNSELVYFIGSNPDPGAYFINNYSEELKLKIIADSAYLPNLERPEFLGLLKNCSRFIGNSSSLIYEAPFFLSSQQIISIGMRNRDRDKGPFMTDASDRIVEVIKQWYTAKNGSKTGKSPK